MFYNDLMKPYIHSKTERVALKPVEKDKEEVKMSENNKILKDFKFLYEQSQERPDDYGSDFKVYCKDHVLHGHLSIFMARSASLLSDRIEDNNGKRQFTILSWDNLEKASAAEIVKYLYCGEFDLSAINSEEQKVECAKICRQGKLDGLLEVLKNEDLENSISGSQGFLQCSVEEEEGPEASTYEGVTQNLSLLLEEMNPTEGRSSEKQESVDISIENVENDNVQESEVRNEESPKKDLEANVSIDCNYNQ